MNLSPGLAGQLIWLLNHSLQAGILVLLVLLVQWLFRRRLTNRWRFALWWLVLLRLLLPFNPSSPLSLFNIVHPAVHLPSIAASRQNAGDQLLNIVQPSIHVGTPLESDPIPDLGPASPMLPEPSTIGPPLREVTPTPAIHFSLPIVITALWLTGILVLVSIVATQLRRFYRQLSSGATPANARLHALFEECRAEFQVTRGIDLLETDAVRSPALFGLLRLRLLLPRGLDTQFNRPELRYIFLHELAHVKRSDLWLNWLVTALQIVHWFNPLLWFGFARLRADRELACDELALLSAGDQVGTAYGQTVIKLLENLNRPAAIPGLIGILEDSRQMRRRIAMIAGFHRPGRWSLLAGLLLAALAAVALTDAQSDQPTPKLRINGAGENLSDSSTTANQSPYDNYFTPENNMVMPDEGVTLPPGQATNRLNLNVEWGRRYKFPAKPTSDSSPANLAFINSILGINWQTDDAPPTGNQVMRYSREVKGRVVLPNGQPAAGITVSLLPYAYKLNGDPGISSAREFLRQAGSPANTLPDGSFQLWADATAQAVVIMDARGCALISLDDLSWSPQITLQKWGRIEGTLHRGSLPCINEPVSVNPSFFTILSKSNVGNVQMPINTGDLLATTTDDQGRFVLPFVPPGKQIFGRHLIQGQGVSGYSQLAVLDVQPGATVVTNIVDPGRTVIATLKYNDAGLQGFHTHPYVIIESADRDEFARKYSELDTAGQRQSYFEQHRQKLQYYIAGPQPDDSLHTEDIPPGQYHLEVTEPGIPTSAAFESDRTFVVPPATDATVYTPVDWGEIQFTERIPTASSAPTPATNTTSATESLSNPQEGINGTVLLPNGQPAANVDVALQTEDWGNWEHLDWYLGKGKFKDRKDLHRHGFLVSTGPDGSFKLGQAAHAVSILVLDERGCAQVSLEQLRQNPQIKLQKWGRIKGTLLVGGRPASNEWVSVTPWRQIGGTNATSGPMFSPEAIAARTDAEGHFDLSQVPPGELVLGRRGTRAEGEGFRMSTVLEVAPGTTVVTNLEDNSRAVIVRLKHHEAGRSEDEISDIVVIETSALVELQKKYTPIRTGADRQAFHDDAGKIRSEIRAYPALPKPDGSFRADGVPPGEYYIHLEEPGGTNGAFIRSEHTLVVPSATGDQVALPVNWDEVNLIDDSARVPARKTIETNSTADSPTDKENVERAMTGWPPSSNSGSGETFKGVVLSPDGQPATNAEVTVPENCLGLTLDWGEFIFSGAGTGGPLETTAPDGSFTMPLLPRARTIAAVSKEGFALMSLEDFLIEPRLRLQKWGRIEGTLIINHKTRPHETVRLEPKLPPWLAAIWDFSRLRYDSDAFQAETDDHGNFAFDFAPPGENIVMHVIPEGGGNAIFSRLENVDVKPGATIVTNVGGTGRTVTGRIKIAAGVVRDWQSRGIISIGVYSAKPRPDGTFRAEDVPVGRYDIQLLVESPGSINSILVVYRSVGTLWVPAAKDDRDDSPVDWGAIQLTKQN